MNTPSTAQRAGIVAHALRSLADHLERFHLPEPGSIEFSSDRIEFSITGGDSAVWQASLGDALDKIDKRTSHESEGVEYVTITGRLPDSGVMVEIDWIAFNVTPANYLQAVTR